MTSLRVSIVSYNTRDQLRRCLTALRGLDSSAGAVRVAVVDNASSDGSPEMVHHEFPEVELHALPENLGFAGGNNVVLRQVGAGYVLILNPDVEVEGESLRRMVAFLERTPNAAAAAPLLVGDDERPQTHLYRRFPTMAQIILFWTVLGPLSKLVPPLRRRFFEHDLRGTRPVAVDQLPGAAILIRGSALEMVGEWDPGYFIWFEDVDWCYRARTAGYELYVLPESRFRHEGGSSFRAWNLEKRVFQFYRAFFRFLCKHRLDRLRRFALPVVLADLRVKGVVLRSLSAVGRTPPENAAATRSARREIKDVVRRWDRGEEVEFSDAVSPGRPNAAASGPALRRVE